MPTIKYDQLPEAAKRRITGFLEQSTYSDKTKTLYRSFFVKYEGEAAEYLRKADLLDVMDWLGQFATKKQLPAMCNAMSKYMSFIEGKTLKYDHALIAKSGGKDEEPEEPEPPKEEEKVDPDPEPEVVELPECRKALVEGASVKDVKCQCPLFWADPLPDGIMPFDPSEYIPQRAKKYIDRNGEKRVVFNIMDAGDPIVLAGPAGTGKTEIVNLYGHMRKIPTFKVNCTRDKTADELLGMATIDPKTGNIALNCGPIIQAILTANHTGSAILFFDEVNTLSPTSQKLLNPLCDDTRSVSLNGKVYSVREDANLIVVGTMNPGYAGTIGLNKELANRFSEITFDPPTAGLLKKILGNTVSAKKAIELYIEITQLQKDAKLDSEVEVSTRTLKKILTHMKSSSLSFEDSATVQIVNKFHNQAQKSIVSGLIKNA